MAMLTDEVRAAYEAALKEKETTLARMMCPPVVATPARGGGKTATQERYQEMKLEMERRRMEAQAQQYKIWPPITRPSIADLSPFPPSPPQRTYTLEELEFRVREAVARATQEERKNSDDRLAIAADAAFERGRAYVEPTPKAPLPIHNAMRATLRAIEQYENKAFLPGGLLPLMHDA